MIRVLTGALALFLFVLESEAHLKPATMPEETPIGLPDPEDEPGAAC